MNYYPLISACEISCQYDLLLWDFFNLPGDQIG